MSDATHGRAASGRAIRYEFLIPIWKDALPLLKIGFFNKNGAGGLSLQCHFCNLNSKVVEIKSKT